MKKLIMVVFSILLSSFGLFLGWRLLDGYLNGWVRVPPQAHFYVELPKSIENQGEAWIHTVGSKYGITKYERQSHGVIALDGLVNLEWRPPSSSSFPIYVTGLLSVTQRNSMDAFLDAVQAVDALLRQEKLAPRVSVHRDPNVTSCADDCSPEIQSPIDRAALVALFARKK